MSDTLQILVAKPPGTALFEQLDRLLPYFANLNEQINLLFSRAVRLLAQELEVSEDALDKKSFSELEPMILRLRERYDLYREQNIIIACAIFIVMAYIESHFLTDADANLVHNLTKLYIDQSRRLVEAVEERA
jgi:hypothetical protein